MASFLILLPSREKFGRGASSLFSYITAAEVLASFIDANKRIQGIQIGVQEMKLVNLADDISIFLRDIIYLNKIEVISKLYEDACSIKINF